MTTGLNCSTAPRQGRAKARVAPQPSHHQGLNPEMCLLTEHVTLGSCPQIQTRIANEKYLRSHKEVELLLSGFFR